MTENVFLSLSKLSPLATENQLTESLVSLLRVLLERSTEQGLWLANHLCDLPQDDGFDPLHLVVTTQVSTPVGIPDIGLWDGRTRAYIEVKHDSPLGPGQLEAYLAELTSHSEPHSLVLLTRSKAWAGGTTLTPAQYHHVCWHEVHDWLDALPLEDAVSIYLAQSFTGFLEAKGMSIDKVTWEYMQGVPSMLRLTQMLETAVAELLGGVPTRRTAGWSWRGLYLTDKGLFLGFRFATPMVVVCENNMGTAPTYNARFDLEREHFFALSAGEQLERLIAWMGKSYEEAPTPIAGTNPPVLAEEVQDPSV